MYNVDIYCGPVYSTKCVLLFDIVYYLLIMLALCFCGSGFFLMSSLPKREDSSGHRCRCQENNRRTHRINIQIQIPLQIDTGFPILH